MSRRQKQRLVRIIVSAGLIILSLFFENCGIVGMIITLGAFIVSGWDVILSALRKIFSFQLFDEEILMSVATICAIVLGEYTEAAMVMTLYQTGELFQGIATAKSRKSIKDLMKLKSECATVIRDGKEIITIPEEVLCGETLLVIPGEKVAIDGIITRGHSLFDSSSLTGESLPVELKEGDRVCGGMINLESPVEITTQSLYSESTVAKILDMVEKSAMYKSRSEKFITKFSKKYTPCVFFAALLTAFVPTMIFGQSFLPWLRRALIFLIVSCPCALVISVPLTFFSAIGSASKKGVLIKGSEYIEILSKVSIFAFDKTGTITCGKFSVCDVVPFSDSEEKIIETAAYAESFSNHPIALAITQKYGKPVKKECVKNVSVVMGKGVSAEINGKHVLAGSRAFLEENSITVQAEEEKKTSVYVAYDGRLAGIIRLEDFVKENAKDSIEKLRQAGIKRVVMLTGDNEKTAVEVADRINADEVCSGLLPQDKVEKVLMLKKEGLTAFAGDGINDAPVLSCVDVGFAMGALGSDAAVEAADIVIMNDDISSVYKTVLLAQRTMHTVRQNIFMSLFVKFLVMAMSVIGYDNMYAAIFADVGVMVLAVINAMRKKN